MNIQFPFENGVAVMSQDAYAESLVIAKQCGCGDCIHCAALAHYLDEQDEESS